MKGLTQEQMLIARAKKMQESGIPVGAGMMNQNSVVQGTRSGSALAKIQAIKSGALQQEFSKFEKATGDNAPGPGGAATFQAIPEAKQKTRPGQPVGTKVSDSSYKKSLQSFTPKGDNNELSSIEAMFGGGRRSMPNTLQQNSMTTDLNIDNVMAGVPSFNPQASLAKTNSSITQEQQHQQQGQFDYTRYALNGSQMGQEQKQGFAGDQRIMESNSFNYQKEMMKQIAEQTVRSILKEFTEGQKNNKTYVNYKNKSNVIKTSDGKLFELVPIHENAKGNLVRTKRK